MGVFEERSAQQPGMHWQQQHDRYIGPAYDPSRDLSPNLPSCDSSMGDADVGLSASSASSSSACSTPSSHNNNNNNNNNNTHPCPSSCASSSIYDHHHQHPVPKLEPLQNPGTPPTPSSAPGPPLDDSGGVAVCAGCGMRIADRFYLQAVDRRWHAACLQCCQCRNTLDGEITCFSRDGNIYCKKDYYRLFGMKRCGRCQAAINSSELVMRARELVFHVHCFSCAVCNCPLTKGDHFGMRDGAVLCRLHFEMSLSGELPLPLPPPPQPTGVVAPGGYHPHHHHHHGPGHYPPPFPSPEFHGHLPPPTPVEAVTAGKMTPFFNGAPATPRQKGRPRKRKPKDLESMTANIDLNSDYLDMPFGRSPGTPGMPGSNQRTKRMRTSFKHHQLRTMKSYFAINHNPDAKDLKQLSQKTGLPKRVLQVWFQNARAKWRRMMLKQEGKSGDKCSGSDGGMADLDIYPQGPASMSGSCQSLPPRSPPFMLPTGSPSSLDCA